MEKGMWLQYPSSIEEIAEQNESFDSCVIKICYTGRNRNRSSISKQVIEDAIPSIYNCPIVCNYNVQDDTIGGHDVEVVSTDNGMRLINLTDAIGVIPYNCRHYWETVSDNGIDHEYLCVEAILWKRSAAYMKIKRDGIVSQSMEITVKDGKTVDGFYEINKFVFTAFCLLGDDVEPCFESASLEMFSLQKYKHAFESLMADFQKAYRDVDTPYGEDINSPNLLKGGNISLDKMELLSEYGLTADAIDFNIGDYTVEELRVKFETIKKKTKQSEDSEDEPRKPENSDGSDSDGEKDKGDESAEKENTDAEEKPNDSEESENDTEDETYSLTGEQFFEQLNEALSSVKYTDPYWGEISKYAYVDYDVEVSEVYCYDCEDGRLYGFPYSMNGDNIIIDYACKKRKKFSIVDFDEGSADSDYRYAFEAFGKSIAKAKDAELLCSNEKYNEASKKIEGLQAELGELKDYRNQKIDEEREKAENDLFARFTDLVGIEAFDELRSNCSDMTIEELESKCYEIKGRNAAKANFSISKPGSTRLIVEKNKFEDEPYGGLFVQYPPTHN